MVALSIDHLGEDSASLKRLLLAREAELAAARAAQATAEAEAARAQSLVKSAEAMIAHYKLLIEKLRRAQYGQRSERSSRLLDQLELQLEEAEATASEAALGAEQAAGTTVRSFTRRKQSRKPFPADLPRERVVVAAPKTCTCCGSDRLAKIGEDVTETLEAVPRQWKVIETVREKFTCRVCEKISQPPAPFHAIPRGLYGPSLLAMILFEKYGQHQPLNRQSRRFAHEGVDLSLSTLADQVGTCAAMVRPLYELQRDYVLSAERLHGDDTTVPVLAPAKTRTGRLWVYVRDDRPFKGGAPPAALFYYSPDRRGEHVERHLAGFAGILQADAYSGFNRLYETDRRPGPITEAACWAHGRRHFYELAEPSSRKNAKMYSPIALQAVQRIDALFAIEREITGQPADVRLDLRRQRSAPLVAELETWMKSERARLSRHADPAKAFDYMLTRWPAFTRFLDDGRICLSNNAAERALRGVALGRKSWMFAGSDAGGERAAVFYSLIVTARLNNIDPQAWLADVLARIADHPINRLKEFLPWNWCKPAHHHATIAA
jgi:transposase